MDTIVVDSGHDAGRRALLSAETRRCGGIAEKKIRRGRFLPERTQFRRRGFDFNGRGGAALLLKAQQAGEGAVEGAVGGVDEALELEEMVFIAGEGAGEVVALVVVGGAGVHETVP